MENIVSATNDMHDVLQTGQAAVLCRTSPTIAESEVYPKASTMAPAISMMYAKTGHVPASSSSLLEGLGIWT